MFSKVFFIILGIVSLVWIGYVSIDILNRGKKLSPEVTFSSADKNVLVINDFTKKNELLSQFQTTTLNLELINQIQSTHVEALFVSQTRNHILLNSKKILTVKGISELFSGAQGFKKSGTNSFEVEGYKGEFYKNICYLFQENYAKNKADHGELVFDKNSTGSIFKFNKTSVAVTDIYAKENGLLLFKSDFNSTIFGNKVHDEAVFSSIISSDISSYEFFETDYLRSTDATFATSIMNDWVKSGIVKITLAGKTALITDQLDGQDPISVLCDALQKEPENEESEFFENIPMMKSFKVPGGFFAYQMDDYVVISADQTTCEKIVADYKLGKTLSQSTSKKAFIYGGLPKKVNHRLVNEKFKQASSVSKNALLTSSIGQSQPEIAEPSEGSSNQGVNINDVIIKFYAINQSRQFVLGISKKVFFVENGEKKWEVQLDGSMVGDGEIIDLFANNKKQLLIATNQKVHLIDVNGNEAPGFPIDLGNEKCTITPAFYRWEGVGYFIVPLASGKFMQYDSSGRELTPLNSKLKRTGLKPVVFVSAGNPYIGIHDGQKFEMINLLNKKSFRVFTAPKTTHIAKITNEVMLFGVENQKLISYNQKGAKAIYGDVQNGKIHSILQQGTNPSIVVQDKSQIQLFNTKGIEWGTIQLPFSDVDAISAHALSCGTLLISAIDGVENNVHLYKATGQPWRTTPLEGSKQCAFFEGEGASYYIISIVDKLLVNYKEN